MNQIDLAPEEYRASAPARELIERYGIAMVGCGSIAQGAHLPAYRDFGYPIVAICDVVEETVRNVAERYGIPSWTTDLDELLGRSDVDVIDLAVPPAARLGLVKRIAPSGKHILSQKPLAPTFREAEEIVEVCERAGVTLMVNQQARWAPYHKAVKLLIDRGVLGTLFSMAHLHRQHQDQPDSKWRDVVDFTIIDNGIHYVDLTRYFSGRTPRRVMASAAMKPGQHAVSPMVYTLLGFYEPNDLTSALHFNNIATGMHHSPYLWYFDGTEAAASIARYGTLRDGRTELAVAFKDSPDQRHVVPIEGAWANEAWAGTMGEMLTALAEGREPQCSGRDNLDSIRVTNAGAESYRSGRAVEVSEIA
jgi:predicted dehydrogenase